MRLSKDDIATIRRVAEEQARKTAGGRRRVRIEIAIRVGDLGTSVNSLLAGGGEDWSVNETDLYDYEPWAAIRGDLPMTEDGRCLLDLYLGVGLGGVDLGHYELVDWAQVCIDAQGVATILCQGSTLWVRES